MAPEKVVANPPPGVAPAPVTQPEAAPEPAPAKEPDPTPAPTLQPQPAPTPQVTAPQPAAPQPAQPPAPQPAGAGRAPEILSPPRTPSPNPNLTFSHEGPRFLLGYTPQYYGIWDKQTPGPPTNRFPRTDEGWQDAWEAFIKAEMGQA